MSDLKVDRITLRIPYEEFFKRYLVGNRPCVLCCDFTDNWQCRKDWVSANGKLNFDFLVSAFGDSDVPVIDCDLQSGYGSARIKTEKFRDFLAYLQLEGSSRPSCKYLKDWHFQRQFPGESYALPEYFSSDWLNEFCDRGETVVDDYRFVYLGPAGSWTPFHEDVLQSFSWSANICGRKKWYLFAPREEEKLIVNGQLPTDIRNADLTDVQYSVVVQEAGEILFVPSRWHHQVHNLEDTMSINHNWINCANAENTWRLLSGLLEKVEKEISDCRHDFGQSDWMTQCQKILRADVAMNFEDFKNMLLAVSRSRILLFTEGDQERQCDIWLWNLDFSCIRHLLRQLTDHVFFENDEILLQMIKDFDSVIFR